MAKRFIDTELFNDPWFMDLQPDEKLLYIYFFTNCDHAGVIEFNKRLTGFQTLIEDFENRCITLTEGLGNRLVRVPNRENLYFLTKFVYFQYPNFPNSSVRAQQSAIKRLQDLGLFEKYITQKQTLNKPLAKGYEHEHEYEHGNGYVNGNSYLHENSDLNEDFVPEPPAAELSKKSIEVITHFGFTEMRNPDKLKHTYACLQVLSKSGHYAYFLEQFKGFKAQYPTGNKYQCNLMDFLGQPTEGYLNGKWNARVYNGQRKEMSEEERKQKILSGI